MARSSHTDPDSWGHEGFPEQGPVHMDRVWWASVNGGVALLGGGCAQGYVCMVTGCYMDCADSLGWERQWQVYTRVQLGCGG